MFAATQRILAVSTSLLIFILFIVTLPGCKSTRYDLELTPDGDSLNRKLSYYAHATEPDGTLLRDEEADRIAEAYDDEPETIDSSFIFETTFSGRAPDDLGGHGNFIKWDSPCGSLNCYQERIRGSDDFASQLSDRRIRIDILVDILIGWFEFEMKGEPGFFKFKAFLDADFRNDMQNLSIYVWQAGFDRADQPDSLLRVLQYFVEREYVKPEAVPRFTGILRANSSLWPELVNAEIRKVVVAKAHPELNAEKATAFMSSPEKLEASFRRFAETSEIFRDSVAKLRETFPVDFLPIQSEDDIDEVSQFAGMCLLTIFPGGIFAGEYLDVNIKLSVEPTATNGNWDAEEGTVSWERSIPGRESLAVPAFIYAIWIVPDEQAQIADFGTVILTGQGLSTFTLWYNELNDEEKQTWDSFVETIDPSGNVAEQLSRHNIGSFAETGIALLKSGITEAIENKN